MSWTRSVVVGWVWQETNTFGARPTTITDFRRYTFVSGDRTLENVRNGDDELGGFCDVLDEAKIKYVPLLSANSWPGGPAAEDLVSELMNGMLKQLRFAERVDGVLLSLHGAMAGKCTYDVEGALISAVRKEVGPNVPIVLTLDHHANVTETMVCGYSALTAYRHCPHTDMRETGRRGARLLLDLLDGQAHPCKSFIKLPIVTPCEQFLTCEGPMRTWFEFADRLKADPAVLDVSLFPVQPWLDVPEFGWSVVVTTNEEAQLAGTICHQLACHAWNYRIEFYTEKLSPPEAVRKASEASGGTVVIADGADATNGGSPGDSNCLLREMLAQQIDCLAYLTLVDPPAVETAYLAGVGKSIEFKLGGHWSKTFHPPISVRASVERLCDGHFPFDGHGSSVVDMGQCAVIRIGSIQVLLSEFAGPGHDPKIFQRVGLDPRDAQIIVVKCTVGHLSAYANIMTESLACECPGPSPSELTQLNYRHVPRPLYPFHLNVRWH